MNPGQDNDVNKCSRKNSSWKTIFLIASLKFTATLCIALQAPFYPEEAKKKGVTVTENGLVFGIFELVSFVCYPVFGKYLDVIGAKFVLTGGALLNGLSCVGFGLLDMVDGHAPFIALSFILRTFEAIGASAIFAAAFAIAATKCSEKVATTFVSDFDVFWGLGYIVGPTVGGGLYQLGGYILPFTVMGGALVFASLMTAIFLEDPPKSGLHPSFLRLMVSPGVVLNAFVTFATAITMGFYSATFEPHLRQFDLSPSQIGGMFMISGSLYVVLALPVGKIVDWFIDPKLVIIFGAILSGVGICLVGPAPFIDAEPSDGFPNDITTNALVSGFWAASFALGAFVGPSVAGYLFDILGFRTATYFVIIANIAVVVAEVLFIVWRSKCYKSTPISILTTVTPEKTESC